VALGVAFVLCFVTGLLSHLIQHPPSWFAWPPRPAWLYRVTQGAHVAIGIAAIPVLLAKLWVVAPKLWTWPPVRGVSHLLERAGLLRSSAARCSSCSRASPASAASDRGASRSRPSTTPPRGLIGALVAHVGAKLHVAVRSLRREAPERGSIPAPMPPEGGLSRRGLMAAAAAAAGAVTLVTIGQTLRPLRGLAELAPRDPAGGPQGEPGNRTAIAANVTDAATSPDYRLVVGGDVSTPLSLSLSELRALPQHEAELPIACVEGWSATGTWRGVPVADLLRLAGAPDGARAELVSLERRGAYSSSIVEPQQVADPDALLALELNGEPLVLDHGFPARLMRRTVRRVPDGGARGWWCRAAYAGPRPWSRRPPVSGAPADERARRSGSRCHRLGPRPVRHLTVVAARAPRAGRVW
jgi:hypothetical protein